MKVTVLIENTSNCELRCEHGLSFLIEQEGKRILLDAGQTEAFYENAKKLGISLEYLSAAVLSHGHYDHSGGFQKLFEANREIKVYAKKTALGAYYSQSGGMHDISVPDDVRSFLERFIFLDGMREILKDIYLIPHSTEGLEKMGKKAGQYKKDEDKLVPDDFTHEQSLVFDTEKGLVIFNSCSHGGVETIIREAREALGGKPVYVYVGGLHMKGRKNGEVICTFSEAELDALCEVIRAEKIEVIYTGHCTGEPGLQELKKRLGSKVRELTTGMEFEL